MAMVDVLDYCVMASTAKGLGFGRETHAWEGVASDALTASKWTRVKKPLGYPWDRKLYDASWVYDWITEQAWDDPRSYKKFVKQRPGAPLPDGVAIFPRFIPDVFFHVETVTPKAQTQFMIFKNCVWDGVYHDLGIDTRHTLTGPYQIDHGGDVGVQPTLIHKYYWMDSGVPQIEENWYALNYGWVRWTLSSYSLGVYRQVNQSVHNKLVAVQVPPIVFPCF